MVGCLCRGPQSPLYALTFCVLTFFQVSGEYAMIKAAAAAGMLDEQKSVLESLLCINARG